MIVYRKWSEENRKATALHHQVYYCDGWFLFGVIPLYVRKRPAPGGR